MAYWTYYWGREQVLRDMEAYEKEGRLHPLDWTSGSGYFKAGLAPGDTLYIINWLDGILGILGRMEVGHVMDRAEAKRELGEIYDADDHLRAKPGTATYQVFDAVVYPEDLDEIEFLRPDGTIRHPKRNDKGEIEHQTFRNVREITADTAELFDFALGFEAGQQFVQPKVSRAVTFNLVFRDDVGREEVVSVEVRCTTDGVPPRYEEVLHSVSDSSLLDDVDRLASLSEDLLTGLLDESDGDYEILYGGVADQVREQLAGESDPVSDD